ncbi:MAG: hypothetical protein U9Q82_12485 [Chloroflexota bacterium]|nr:hypothetical protein [Chloroflexota bacterium]
MATKKSKIDKFYDTLNMVVLEEEITLYREYIQFMENHLTDETEKYQKLGIRLRKKRHERHKQEYKQVDLTEPPSPEIALADTQEQKIATVYASILRMSFFVSLYSFLEAYLIEECRYREHWGRTSIPLEDVIHGGIDKAKECLKVDKQKDKDCLKNQIDFGGNEWRKIKELQELRNFVVHSGNSFDNAKENKKEILEQIVEKEQTLSRSGDGILFRRGFCEKALIAIEDFINLT